MPEMRSVSVALMVGAGSRHEPAELSGISHYIEHMLFKGTARYPTSKDVSLAVEGVGGAISASTGKETTVYWAKVASDQFERAFDVLSDMLLHPTFAPEEVEKERRVILEELAMSRDNPADWVAYLVEALLWPGHPLGRDTGGTRETVSAITREQLLDYVATHYGPENLVVTAAGRIEHAQVVDAAQRHLGGWRRPIAQATSPAATDGAINVVQVERRRTEQANFCLALPALSRRDPDRYALQVLSAVLGEGSTSRLFLEIREKQSLAYDVGCYVEQFEDAGALVVYGGVDPRRLEIALEAILAEIQKLVTEGVTPEELDRCREYLKGGMLLGLENTYRVAAWYGSQELMCEEVLTPDEVVARIEAVTLDDLARTASRVLAPGAFHLAVIGPGRGRRRLHALLDAASLKPPSRTLWRTSCTANQQERRP